MKPLVILTLLIISLCNSFAQTYKPLKDEAGFNKMYLEKAKDLNSLACRFTQVKSISLLEKKLVSEGTFQYRKTSMLRMEYTSPFQYVFILNNDKVIIISNKQETTISTSSSKIFKVISQITIDCVSGNIFNNKNFKSHVLENDNSYLIELVPVSDEIKTIMDKIKVVVLKQDYTVEKVEMFESSGDFTQIVFKDKEINKPIPDAAFAGK